MPNMASVSLDVYMLSDIYSSKFSFKQIMSFLTFLYLPVPVLVVALEKVERSPGSLIGNSIASIQKSTAPEVIF